MSIGTELFFSISSGRKKDFYACKRIKRLLKSQQKESDFYGLPIFGDTKSVGESLQARHGGQLQASGRERNANERG